MRDMGIPLFSASTDKELLDDYVDGPITAAVSLARHTSLGLRPGGSEASQEPSSLGYGTATRVGAGDDLASGSRRERPGPTHGGAQNPGRGSRCRRHAVTREASLDNHRAASRRRRADRLVMHWHPTRYIAVFVATPAIVPALNETRAADGR